MTISVPSGNPLKFVQTQAVALYTGISAVDTSAVITPYPRDIQTNTKLVMADFGETPSITIDPKIPGYEEICTFTGLIDNGDGTGTITGLTRNLIGQYPYTTPGTGKQHGSSAVVVFSDNPQLFARLAALENDNVYSGNNSYDNLPTSSAGNATDPTELITYGQALSLLTGGGSINSSIVSGIAGETIAKDKLIYLKNSDGRWWLADADTASTDENVILGISQGSGTAGNSITSGILTYGLATFTAITVTANTKYYASNTAGGFSSTPGTTEVTVGYALSTTTMFFNPRYDQQLTEDQQDALIGNGGTPSNTNKYITQSGYQAGSESYIADASGSSIAYTATLSPAIAAYTDGMRIYVKIVLANTTTTPSLNVNGLGAKTIVKLGGTALAVSDISVNMYCSFIYDLGNTRWIMQNPTATSVSATIFQSIPFYVGTSVTAPGISFQTNSDGSVAYMSSFESSVSVNVYRLARDANTLQYYITHAINVSPSSSFNTANPQLIVTSTFLYLAYVDNGTETLKRYSLADLTGATGMTISGGTGTFGGSGFSDGTNLYIWNNGGGVYKKYTISGTTATFSTNITLSSGGSSLNNGTCCDGTNIWTTNNTNGVISIYKYSLAGGTAISTTSIYIYADAFVNHVTGGQSAGGTLALFISSSSKLGIAFAHTSCSATAVIGSIAEISAISLP